MLVSSQVNVVSVWGPAELGRLRNRVSALNVYILYLVIVTVMVIAIAIALCVCVCWRLANLLAARQKLKKRKGKVGTKKNDDNTTNADTICVCACVAMKTSLFYFPYCATSIAPKRSQRPVNALCAQKRNQLTCWPNLPGRH